MKSRMQEQSKLAFAGYDETDVKSALDMIRMKSSEFDIKISDPILQKRLVKNQPKFRGCDRNDLTVFSVTVTGKFENAKKLVKTDTPLGVQIDLLPLSA